MKSIGNLDIWIVFFLDLCSFGDYCYLFGICFGEYDSGWVGGGCVLIKIEEGWLILYYGVIEENCYVMGVVFFDLNDLMIVLKRMKMFILELVVDYEKNGFFGDVVFVCGVI